MRRDCRGPKGQRAEKQTYGYVTGTISRDTCRLIRAVNQDACSKTISMVYTHFYIQAYTYLSVNQPLQ